ncbi:nucleotide-binding universal stress UspA family protein [Yoonia maricola]|uniref:Nucleotide-binding universal stress UspA family protein n=1 Tax=Yoonia maricola TaxID=420999 RepID=A0A2M8W373_9RHOB|nr:universal stress protein [Yoonia maricola]PJI85392.1 nucleotide-binding universal stress UspA family protein [Yoonia maricola]
MPSKILVPVRGDGMIETVLGHAAALAARHNAHIVVAHCRARTEDLMPYGVQLPSFARDTLAEQVRQLAEREEEGARAQVNDLAAALGLTQMDGTQRDVASIDIVEEDGLMADIIKRNGRLADLVVVAKPDRDRNLGSNSLKSALFRTGRPVMMCPLGRSAPSNFGQHIAVAWNGSLEASRAVAMTLDLAESADTVTILSGGMSDTQGATADELVNYYQLHGVTANVHRFDGRNPGEELLKKTTELGASLLVMGAYGQNHERETLFGGNTQIVVDKAEIPVVFVH